MPDFRTLTLMADGVTVAEGCHLRASGKSTMSLLPDTWEIEAINIGYGDYAALTQASVISVHGQHDSTLFEGTPIQVTQSAQGPNLHTLVVARDGDAFWQSSVSVTLRRGSTVSDSLRVILGQCGSRFRSVLHVDGLRSTFPRGQTYFCRTANAIKDIAAQFGLIAYVFRNTLFVSLPSSAVEVTLTDDDMIEAPQAVQDGYILTTDVFGQFVGRNVRLDTSSVSGVYRIAAQMVDADNTSGDWKSQLVVYDTKRLGV